jgi:hypothetical protein
MHSFAISPFEEKTAVFFSWAEKVLAVRVIVASVKGDGAICQGRRSKKKQ